MLDRLRRIVGVIYDARTISRPQGEIDLTLVHIQETGRHIALTVLSTSKVICLPHVWDESMTGCQSRMSLNKNMI